VKDDSLFRTEALDAQRTNWLGPVSLSQPLSFSVFAAIALLATCCSSPSSPSAATPSAPP
jgi:hypothetical protein